MNLWKDFPGPNAAYVLDLYERYKENPESVDPETRVFFDRWQPAVELASTAQSAAIEKIVAVVNLAQAIREHGHLNARLDPLGSKPPGDPSLELSSYNLTEDDLRQLPASLVGGPIASSTSNALDALLQLREVYCTAIGYEYDHIHDPVERQWLRDAAESRLFNSSNDPIDPKALLGRLTEVEVFERFLHRVFPGKTRFSLEGLDMMVPVLDEVILSAAEVGIRNVLIGMAHRGRLNVLAHVLNKPYVQILAEFKDPVKARDFREDLGWTGDVKYHAGARRSLKKEEPLSLVVSMAPNPSHLEAVNPVVEGMARAAGESVDQPGPPVFNRTVTLPILIHGDASFPAQGVVAETLNLSRIAGYSTAGTVHIIANNQLGYTTPPGQARSTLYASDMAKGFEIPIVHVNADEPEACLEAARFAFSYRARFHKDSLVDLIGYRRYGHNEGDEPSFTQPLMYATIESHPTVRQIWANRLAEQKIVSPEEAEDLVRKRMDALQKAVEALKAEEELVEPLPEPPPPGAARRCRTAVEMERLKALNECLLHIPEGFHIHRKLERAIERRRKAFSESPNEAVIDWATAEDLAFASIIEDGTSIRLTGQDTERGTFSQRHAVFHDVQTGEIHVPLQRLPQAKAAFEVLNSPLSEMAAIGFEYGYSLQEPGRMVLWEAQYGDFINGAQVTIDEFVISGRAKWGQSTSLVLLLPHAYEGQGPDHSSARIERFLQLAAETNIRVANCTTAAQYFHLLRRQAALLKTDPLPLIVMTPKSLLRHPLTASPLNHFTEGAWQPFIDDSEAQRHRSGIRRLVLCSGKIYVDLVTSELRAENPEIAVVRVEQLYPFRTEILQPILEQYSNLLELAWVQEEPENMGAWSFLRPYLEELVNGRLPIRYIGRRANSSPAEGSAAWHSMRQEAIISQALTLESEVREKDLIQLKKV
jgi:2-oxoglutarate dehydrogenase E1 component